MRYPNRQKYVMSMLLVMQSSQHLFQNEEKIKYAKWKAASIARNVRDNGSDEAKASSGSKSLPTSSSERRKSDPLVISAKPSAGSTASKIPADLLSSDRYLAPPQQKGASPSVPSSFGSLPASTAGSTNPSPSSAPQVPLPVSSNVPSDAKLSNPRVTPLKNDSSPDPPTNKLSASPSESRTVEEKPSTSAPSKTPTAAPSGVRPRRQTNEGLPKSGFFASIAGKMFGFRDGQMTPDVWSHQSTPGTEIQLPLTSVPAVNGEAKGKTEKAPSPLSRPSPPPAEGAARSLLGGAAAAIVPSTRDDMAMTSTRPSVTPSSNPTENGKESVSRKPEHTHTSNPPGANAQTSAALGSSVARKKSDVPPLRDILTAGIVRPSPPSQPAVTVISLIPEQTIPNLPGGSQRPRQASEDKQQGRRDESPPIPSRVPETDQWVRKAERQEGLPSVLPAQPFAFARVAALKRVHFSGSVVGGLSTDAGTSPPQSPTELKQHPLKTHAVGSNGTSFGKQETPGSSLRRSASDSASQKPQLLSTTAPRLAGPEHTPLVAPQEDSIGSSMNPSVAHSRHLSDSSLYPSFSPVESDPTTFERSPRRSPNGLSLTSPLSVPEGRHRSHSLGQSSLVGSAGSYNTMTLNRSASRPPVSAPPPSSSPKARPMAIPPISKTSPPIQQQQPTPSPSPPSAQLLPLSYTAVPAPVVTPVSAAIAVPPVPGISISPSFTQSKPAATHVPTPYTRPQDLPAALTAEVMLNARKHTKYAMSALEFDDVETARKQLRLALEALEAE